MHKSTNGTKVMSTHTNACKKVLQSTERHQNIGAYLSQVVSCGTVFFDPAGKNLYIF